MYCGDELPGQVTSSFWYTTELPHNAQTSFFAIVPPRPAAHFN